LLETGELLTTPGSLLYAEHNAQIDNQS
jgi:hypothetical protein